MKRLPLGTTWPSATGCEGAQVEHGQALERRMVKLPAQTVVQLGLGFSGGKQFLKRRGQAARNRPVLRQQRGGAFAGHLA